jgi:hypothetical protein
MTTTTERSTMTDQTAVPCNAARLHRFGDLQTAHGPHEWIVQPGMDPVRCPGAGEQAAAPAVQAPAADRAALRDRIAEAIQGLNEGGTLADLDEEVDVLALADAVLAVLPTPVDRAAVLRDAAEAVLGLIGTEARLPQTMSGVYRAADLLRRLAGETQQDGARP